MIPLWCRSAYVAEPLLPSGACDKAMGASISIDILKTEMILRRDCQRQQNAEERWRLRDLEK